MDEVHELRDRAERAESELAAAHHERDRMFLDAREWATRFGEMEARAERAEAELAALKARIADAPMGVTRVCPYVVCIDIEGDEPYLIAAGKNVRLVVEE